MQRRGRRHFRSRMQMFENSIGRYVWRSAIRPRGGRPALRLLSAGVRAFVTSVTCARFSVCTVGCLAAGGVVVLTLAVLRYRKFTD